MRMNRIAPVTVLCMALGFSGCGRKEVSQADAEKQLADAQKQLEVAQKQVEEAKSQAADAKAQGGAAGQPGSARGVAGGAGSTASRPAAGEPSKPAMPAPPREVTIPAGTPIVVRTTNSLSTKTAANGAPFAGSLERDLTVDGHTIAPRGADVTGIVVASDPGGKVKGVASIAVTLSSIATPAGPIRIRTDNRGAQAKSSVKKDVVKGGIMTGVGAAIGAIAGGGKGAAIGAGAGAAAGTGTAMMTRGEAAVIPAESVLTFKLAAPVTAPLN